MFARQPNVATLFRENFSYGKWARAHKAPLQGTFSIVCGDTLKRVSSVFLPLLRGREFFWHGSTHKNGKRVPSCVQDKAKGTESNDSTPFLYINNLSDFVFSAIKAIGAILLGFGIVQIGLALKGHDASQRAQGFMTFFGGVVIYFAKDILDMIL